MPTKDFEPLMIAIQQVLEVLGTPSELDHPLNVRSQTLQELYAEYDECCCQRADVVTRVSEAVTGDL